MFSKEKTKITYIVLIFLPLFSKLAMIKATPLFILEQLLGVLIFYVLQKNKTPLKLKSYLINEAYSEIKMFIKICICINIRNAPI